MQEPEDATMDQVVGTWLKQEWRFCEGLATLLSSQFQNAESLIMQPDYNDSAENQTRLRMLESFRWFFRHFREEGRYKVHRWKLIEYDERDLVSFIMINSGDWKEISRSLKPMDIARTLHGELPPNLSKYKSYQDDLLSN